MTENELRSVILAVLVGIFLVWKFKLQARDHSVGDAIQLAVKPTRRTIMSGTTPHEMSGEISKELKEIAKLPHSGWIEIQIPKDIIKNALRKVKSINTFSVLGTQSTIGTESNDKVNGIDISFRADFIRPDKIHVSQSLWDDERGFYALDEWITLGENTFVNAGIWGKFQDHETIERLSGINNSLLPETILFSFNDKKFENSGHLNVAETSFIFLQTAIEEEQGVQQQQQVWIDETTEFIRKHRLAVYEENTLVGEIITTFVEHADQHSISAPEWLNMDSTNTIINDSVCIVEHW